MAEAGAGHTAFRPRRAGIAARVVAALAIAAGILVQPLVWDNLRDQWLGLAAIFAVIGLSVNVLTGHAGQISLGHQAFVGIGAFMSAFLIGRLGAEQFAGAVPTANFLIAVAGAGAMGAVMAIVLGLIA